MPKLSDAQRRYLDEITEAGERRYNGNARKPVEFLAKHGLITYEYDLVSHSKGNGIQFTELFICRPTGKQP